MKWSPQQDDALRRVKDWIATGNQPFFYLGGFAGTGKTTLAKELADGVGYPLFGAFTGKAALVLSEKGCPAKTIHQLIYTPKGKSKARLSELKEALHKRNLEVGAARDRDPECLRLIREIEKETENLKRMAFTLNEESEVREADLLVIDECSMVDQQMGEDILYFGTKVLVLGDPAQLPPVRGEGFFTKGRPDFMLTDIHRQAKDSPIIEMATKVREGGSLSPGSYGDCTVHARGADMSDVALKADQILCGKNDTRRGTNARVRELLGHRSHLPEAGERMVCLKNDHEKGLLNGQIWTTAQTVTDFDDDTYLMEAYPEGNEKAVQEFQVWNREPEWYEITENQNFDFGYALTCHKAQGSQWDHVMVMDQSRVFRQDAKKWLYTAITRAAVKLDIIPK